MKLLILLLVGMLMACGGSSSVNGIHHDVVVKQPTSVGMSTFALANQNFPVDRIIDIWEKTNLRPSIAVLYRTFGEDLANYNSFQNAFGGDIELQIYALCGPCRRPRRDGKIEVFYPQYDINELNVQLLTNPVVRESYRNQIRGILKKYVDPYPNSTFTIIPELESNMTKDVVKLTYNITKELTIDYPNVNVKINTLSNSRLIDVGVERHTISDLSSLNVGDVINFDGASYYYPDESIMKWRDFKMASFDDIKDFIQRAINKDVFVYLWRPDWQGIESQGSVSSTIDRNYQYYYIHDPYLIVLLTLERSNEM